MRLELALERSEGMTVEKIAKLCIIECITAPVLAFAEQMWVAQRSANVSTCMPHCNRTDTSLHVPRLSTAGREGPINQAPTAHSTQHHLVENEELVRIYILIGAIDHALQEVCS